MLYKKADMGVFLQQSVVVFPKAPNAARIEKQEQERNDNSQG